jgi:TetR/AcrR family transcriptional regulator, mexCD-oprJ operon repressor
VRLHVLRTDGVNPYLTVRYGGSWTISVVSVSAMSQEWNVSKTEAPTRRRAQRADARRNIEAIVAAGTSCLAADPSSSIADIAAAAGVGRMTLYGHFKTRGELVDAVLQRTLDESNDILKATDTSGDPQEAMMRLIGASWQLVHRFGNVLTAAHDELPPERIHGAHDRVLRRVQTLVERGQRAGTFRNDLPKNWLVSLAVRLMHSAADDVAAGRLKPAEAPGVIASTLFAALTPVGRRVSAPSAG